MISTALNSCLVTHVSTVLCSAQHQGGLPTAAAAAPGRVAQREREHREGGRNALKQDEHERQSSATPPEMSTSKSQ